MLSEASYLKVKDNHHCNNYSTKNVIVSRMAACYHVFWQFTSCILFSDNLWGITQDRLL